MQSLHAQIHDLTRDNAELRQALVRKEQLLAAPDRPALDAAMEATTQELVVTNQQLTLRCSELQEARGKDRCARVLSALRACVAITSLLPPFSCAVVSACCAASCYLLF